MIKEKMYRCVVCACEFPHLNTFRGGRPPQTCLEHRFEKRTRESTSKRKSGVESPTEASQ